MLRKLFEMSTEKLSANHVWELAGHVVEHMVVAVVVAVVVARLPTVHRTVAVAVVVVVVQEVDHAVVHDIDVDVIHDHVRVHVIVVVVVVIEVFRHVSANVHVIRATNELEMAMVNDLVSVLLLVAIVVDPNHLTRCHALDRVQNNVHLNDNRPVEPMVVVDHVVRVSTIVVVATQLAHLPLVLMETIVTIDHRSLPVWIRWWRKKRSG